MNTNRIERTFKNKETVFIAYITAGDPDYDTCLSVVDSLVEGGIDILELGLPFSDPLADGEVNQLSAQRALNSGMTPKKCIELVSDIRKKHFNLPIIFYTYLNPVAYAQDFNVFCRDARESGLDGLLLLDLIPEESLEFKTIAEKNEIGLVALAAPNTAETRMKIIADYASSFIYYVSREGVTGERKSFAENVGEKISIIKKYTNLPVVVGFGISSPEHVKTARDTGVDGIVVGSAIVKRIQKVAESKSNVSEIGDFVRSLTSILNK